MSNAIQDSQQRAGTSEMAEAVRDASSVEVVDDVIDITTESAVEQKPPMDDQTLKQALEAVLIISDQPISAIELATSLSEPVDRVSTALTSIADEYAVQQRGFELRPTDDGWRFYSARSCSEVVAAYVRDGKSAKLTQAGLETLAVVAYRQPISRARIGAIRGVNVDGVIRTLLSRGLVGEAETDAQSGAVLYGTTSYFLERMGLATIDELPPIADHLPDLSVLDDFIDPQG